MSETSIANISKKYGITEKAVIEIILKEEIEAFFINDAVRVVKHRDSPYQEDRVIQTFDVAAYVQVLPEYLKVLRNADKVTLKVISRSELAATYMAPPLELTASKVFVVDTHLSKFIGDTAKKPEEQPAHDSLDNPGGDHPMQEQYFLDEMKRRKIPNFLEVPNGERASLIRFFVNHGLMGEEVASKAWQRLLDRKPAVVKSVTNTRKGKA